MELNSVLLWGAIFLASLGLAALFMMLWDNTKANIATRKIIGSTREESKRSEALHAITSRVSFNKEETKKKFIAAGIYSDFLVDTYYLFKIIPFVLCLVAIGYGYLSNDLSLFMTLIYLLGAVIACIIGPDAYISSRGKSNIKHISSRLPFLLDLMNVCVHSGMTIESSLDYLSKELNAVDKHLAYVVRVTVERSKVVGIEKALEEFYELVPTSESQSFVMTLIQSLQFGSSVGPVLATLATDIREINMMDLEEKIGKMGAKMSIPLIAFIMVPIVVLIVAPGIMRMLM
ncbi:type II secretion system F family protein [Vibrio sp. TRT 21S02]|uniref:type II secretion system F family protein n=1 Tax=Vibrio sp. TRT 21S02 TaxID=3418507 RepID=UPI003CEF151F